MVDVVNENLNFMNEVNSDSEQQDSTLSDEEDTAANLFNSFMEIAKTAELQKASDTSTDFVVVNSDDNCLVNDGAKVTVPETGAILGEESNLHDNADSNSILSISNSSEESSEKLGQTDEQPFKTGEASKSIGEESSKELKRDGFLVKNKKKSNANISDRLSRTLDNLDVLEQQLFTFMQTQTEQSKENKDGEIEAVCNTETKEEDTFNKPENDGKELQSMAPLKEIDEEDVSLMSCDEGEKTDSNQGLKQNQEKQVADNEITESEIQMSSVEHQKPCSENDPRQEEHSKLENVLQEKDENNGKDEKEQEQGNNSEGNETLETVEIKHSKETNERTDDTETMITNSVISGNDTKINVVVSKAEEKMSIENCNMLLDKATGEEDKSEDILQVGEAKKSIEGEAQQLGSSILDDRNCMDKEVINYEDLKREHAIEQEDSDLQSSSLKEFTTAEVALQQDADNLSAEASIENVAEPRIQSNALEESATAMAALQQDSDNLSAEASAENVAKPQIPGIEIEMIDESGKSELKSLDSLEIDGSPTLNRPESPILSDEGVDSDSHSDLDESFDKRKSWHLELSHFKERRSSDSSTMSEREYQLSLPKCGEGAGGLLSDGDYIRGHLLKLGGSGFTPRNWQKRWCTLKRDNCLYYYKTSREKVPCGAVVLSNYSISKGLEVNRKFCFKLSKGGARTYYFCAADETGMRQWMMALMDAAQRSSEKGAKLQICEGNVHNVSIPALSIQDPDCHGYLLKHGSSLRSWKRRYCVLKNGYLYYYSDMSNTMALGVARLTGYAIEMGEHHGKRYCFRGIPQSTEERTYIFAAETETDRKSYVTVSSEIKIKEQQQALQFVSTCETAGYRLLSFAEYAHETQAQNGCQDWKLPLKGDQS